MKSFSIIIRKNLYRTGFILVGFLLMASCSNIKHESKQLQGRPNILFCLADDAAYPHMGAYGTKWVKTPGFDCVADQGILFTRAYTPNAKCAPSRACIITGRNSWQLEAAANHWCYFPKKFKTYAEVLSGHGYYVGYTGKGWAPGVPGKINGKLRQLVGKPWQKILIMPPTNRISKTDYFENFKVFLENKPNNKPFCFWYGGHEPHRGYEYASGIKKGGMHTADIDSVYSFWPDNDTVRTDMLDYAFEIEYFDSHLVKMLELLKQKGELNNTIVIVSGDNGMPFPRCKGQEYENSNHMPLAIMWKNGIKYPGRIVDDFVSFIDFTPTFLEVAGVDPKKCGMQPIQGKSLTDIFLSSKSGITYKSRDHVLIGKERHDVGRPHDAGYPIRGIIKSGYLYVHNFKPDRWPAGNPETGYLNCDGSPTKTVILNEFRKGQNIRYWKWSFGKRPQDELYNIEKDPDCIINLADKPAYQNLMKDMREQLFTELKEQGDPRMFGKGDVFDQYPYADTQDTSFYERYMRGEKLPSGWVNKSDFEKELTIEKKTENGKIKVTVLGENKRKNGIIKIHLENRFSIFQ